MRLASAGPEILGTFAEIGSLSRMNDDGTNIIVSQQRRDLVFGDWTSVTIFVPRRVWIGEKLLYRLLRCYFRAILGEHRPQSRQQLYSDAWLIWSAREVNRRPTCLLGPTTTSMLRNLQQQFPISVQPVVKAWRLQGRYGKWHGWTGCRLSDRFGISVIVLLDNLRAAVRPEDRLLPCLDPAGL